MIDPQIPTTKISRGQSSQITILLGMGGRVLPWVAAIAALAYALSAGTNIFHYGITRVEWVDWLMLCFATVAGLSGIAYFKIFRYFISEREKYYQLLLDQSSDLTSVLELDGTIQYTSRGIEKILGYTPEELLHKNSFDFVHPEDIAGVRQTFEKGLRSPGTQHVSQYRFKHKDGSWRVLETAGSRLSASPQGVQVIVNTRDMTERNAMADKLRLLQMAANSVSDGIVVCDALDKDMPLRYVNPAFEKMTGYTEAEALGRNPRFLQRENRNQPGLDIIRLALPKGEGCNATVQNYRKDGTPFWNEIRIRPVRDAMGQLTHFVGIKTDVTERILANQKLRESEERFRQLAENIQQVFWLCTPDHAQMVYVSAAYEKIWGRTRESLYQDPLSFAEAIHPDDRLRVIAAAKSLGDGFDQQYRIIRPDGEIHCIHARAFPVVDGSGKVFRYAGIAEDITDSQRIVEELKTSKDMLEKAQAQLIQSEKLAGI